MNWFIDRPNISMILSALFSASLGLGVEMMSQVWWLAIGAASLSWVLLSALLIIIGVKVP